MRDTPTPGNTPDLAGAIDDQRAAEIFSSSNVAFVITDPAMADNPIIYVNRAFERLTGYSSEAVIGRNCRFLQCDGTDAENVSKLRDAIAAREEVSVVLLNQRSNGKTFLNALVVTPIFEVGRERVGQPSYYLGMQREVARDQEQDQLRAFENTVSEVQHRVKNHLSMILALIRMQSRRQESETGLQDIARRIESLQLLYEEMSAAQRVSNQDVIQLGTYIGRVATAIAHLDGRPGVRMNVDVPNAVVETDRAARIGLIISEILTNSMQHAFKGRDTGLIELRAVRTDGGGLRVTISDDGVGLPENVNWPQEGGLGSRIVQGLAEGLGSSIQVMRGKLGTVIVFDISDIKLDIPEPERPETMG